MICRDVNAFGWPTASSAMRACGTFLRGIARLASAMRRFLGRRPGPEEVLLA